MTIPRYSWPVDPSLQIERLEDMIPSERLALLLLVAERASAVGLPLYLVGGFVRDLLLGQPGVDFDLVVEGDAITLARLVADKYGGKITAHTRFGTAKWSLAAKGTENAQFLDFISARRETYTHPGALPSVRSGTLADDLARRDFTINTLALRLDGDAFGELRDDLGGLEDLNAGVLRVLHAQSYQDDPTRILRAVRYEQRYGFHISASDLEYIARARTLLAGLSADRVRRELDLIFTEDQAPAMLARLGELGALKSIHPALPWKPALQRTLEGGLASVPSPAWGHLPDLARIPLRTALGYLLWLMHLAPEQMSALDSRLHFPASLRDGLTAASALLRDLSSLNGVKPSLVFARLEGLPLLVIYAVSRAADVQNREILEAYGKEWRHVHAKTGGKDLKAYGLPSGPAYQVILRSLRNAWLDGEVHSAAEEQALLEKLIRKVKNPSKNAKSKLKYPPKGD